MYNFVFGLKTGVSESFRERKTDNLTHGLGTIFRHLVRRVTDRYVYICTSKRSSKGRNVKSLYYSYTVNSSSRGQL